MVVAGTGHRPDKLGGYNNMQKLAKFAAREISILKTDLIITGMALGWDQALAYAAIKNNIPFIAYVPFLGQERMWPKESQDRFNKFLKKASEIKIICEGGYSPYKMQIRNEAMVNDSDIILALWDGTSGGTHNCIKYATKVNKRIINLYDNWKIYE